MQQKKCSNAACAEAHGAAAPPLKKCPCGSAAYCGVDCQRAHWPSHKAACVALRNKAAAPPRSSRGLAPGEEFMGKTEDELFCFMAESYVSELRGELPREHAAKFDAMSRGWREHVERELHLTAADRGVIARTSDFGDDAVAVTDWVRHVKCVIPGVFGLRHDEVALPSISRSRVRELCLQRNLTPAQTEVECLVLSLIGFSGERLKELQERLIAVRAFFTRGRGLPPRALRALDGLLQGLRGADDAAFMVLLDALHDKIRAEFPAADEEDGCIVK